ncbi:MAG: helix-hairpin-helix domain-containing protein, partial [Candidatus Hodarchaeota archaeon]
QKFDSFNSKLDQEKPLLPTSTVKENLTVIKGIGVKVADQLTNAGIKTLDDLAHCSVNRLAIIEGIGKSAAQKFINGAKERLNMRKLNKFSGDSQDKEFSSINFDIENDNGESETEFEDNVNSFEYSDFEEELGNIKKTESKPWFDEKYKYSRLGRSYDTKKEIKASEENEKRYNEISSDIKDNIIQKSADKNLDIQTEILRQKNFELIDRARAIKKILTHSQIKDISIGISKELELSDFFIIKKTPELRPILIGIDLLAIRPMHMHEFLDIIFIVPIKICTLTEALIVSDTTISYHSREKVPENDYHLEKLVQSYIKALSNCGQLIYEDIGKEGVLFRFFTKYLHLDISLEKTLTHKNLFLRSGPLQYKILIEPVLVSQNKVLFTEKLIPFAYQKISNVHVVEVSHLSNLLQYLDQKYFLIETYSKQKSSLALYCEASNKFVQDLRNYSAPFMIYGAIFLLILLFQQFSILFFLINLGYGVVAFYTLVVGYIYIRFHKHKIALQHEFASPYFQKKFDFDDTDLILIREELSKPLMTQFTYEMLGKDADSKIISELEKDSAENYLKMKEKEREERNKDSISNLFESETHLSENSKLKNKLVEKYSSFLED